MNPRPETDDATAAATGTAPGAGGPVAQILAANRDRFLRFLQPRVGSRELAEEILHEALVRGLGHAGSLREDESALAWFYRLLRNTLTDHFRQQGTRQRAHDAIAAQPEPPTPGPDDELYRAVCACVGDTLATLKPEYAQALRLVDLDDGDVSALATTAQISTGNAAVRLHRARQSLRKRLEQICGSCCTQHGCVDCSCSPTPRSPARDRAG